MDGHAASRAAGDPVRVRTRRPGPPLLLLAAVSALAPSALHMLVPSMPRLAAVFAAPIGAVQLVLTLFLAGIAAGQLVYGPLSDRFGRRPVLLAGLAVFLCGTALCGVAWSLPAHPPIACSTRPMISAGSDQANPQSAVPHRKTARPASSTGRRPNRSDSGP